MKNVSKIVGTSACALLLGLATPAFAQDVNAQLDVEVEANAEIVGVSAESDLVLATPALWKVADDDTTIYLFGTVHFLPDNLEWYRGPISEAVQASDVIVKELGPEASNPATMQAAQVKYGLLPRGTVLTSLLSEDQLVRYKTALEANEMPLANYESLRPWLAALLVTVTKFAAAGYTAQSGVEMVLRDKNPDKPWQGLETVEEQFALFAGVPEQEQIEFLLQSLESDDEISEMLDSMVGEWRQGNAEELAEIMNASMDDPAFAEAFLYSRNRNWAEWIENRLADPGTVFIAVGTGHLAGPNSVQDYLNAQGIEVTRIQ